MTDVVSAPVPSPLASLLKSAPDATLAIALDVQRFTFGIIGRGVRLTVAAADLVLAAPPVRRPVARWERRVATIAATGAQRRRAEAPRVTVAMSRAEQIIATALQRGVSLLPIEALVSRIDVDAILRQVDVNALVSRIDLSGMISEVLAGINLGDLIQDSTTNIVADVRDSSRVQAANADGRIAGLVDKVLLRRRERDLIVPGYNLSGAT
jgi:hypothetical protein